MGFAAGLHAALAVDQGGFFQAFAEDGAAIAGAGGTRGTRGTRRRQRRFWEHTLRDERHYAAHVDYVHFNPIKHGYVQAVIDWPHSTFHRYLAERVYSPDWGGVGDDAIVAAGERG